MKFLYNNTPAAQNINFPSLASNKNKKKTLCNPTPFLYAMLYSIMHASQARVWERDVCTIFAIKYVDGGGDEVVGGKKTIIW